MTHKLATLAALAGLVAIGVSACGDGKHQTAQTSLSSSTAPVTRSDYGHPGDPSQADRTITIKALDTLRFDPASSTVRHGETVTFAVDNEGSMAHEFVLGDTKVQDDHEQAMQVIAAKGMTGGQNMKDEPNAIDVPAGQTKNLTWTFTTPGTVIYGCHEPGHYSAGMKGTITVT